MTDTPGEFPAHDLAAEAPPPAPAPKVPKVPKLGPTIAKILLVRSPAHAWAFHRDGGNLQPPPSDAMIRGSVLDRMFFGELGRLVVIEAPDYRTKAAQETRAQAQAAGLLPVLDHQFNDYSVAVNRWRDQLQELGVLLDGESHRRIDWMNGLTPCSGELDHLTGLDGRATIWDLKTCQDASPNACARAFGDHGYDVQAAAYLEAVHRTYPGQAGRARILFIFAETAPPYLINIIRPGATFREIGALKWARAVEIWGRCLAANHWPGYPPITTIEAKPWQMNAAGLEDPEEAQDDD